MIRVKFVVFALLALGALAAQLFLVSPRVGTRAEELAASQAAAVPAVLGATLDERRHYLQTALLEIVRSHEVLAAFKGGSKDAPTAERFAAVRAAALKALPESMLPTAIIAWQNEAGAAYVRGNEELKVPKDEFDLTAMTAAGAAGQTADAFGSPHLFVAVPLSIATGSDDAKPLGIAVVGAPVMPPDVVESVVKRLNLGALALVLSGQVVSSAGPDKDGAPAAIKALKPGQTAVVEKGSVAALGPIKLPMLTHEDLMGGQAALTVASRQELRGTAYEVLAFGNLRPFMVSLANYQKLALLLWGGLFVLALVWTVLMGGGAKAAEAAPVSIVVPKPVAAPAPAPVSAMAPPSAVATPSLPLAAPEPVPEASPDDFQFGLPPPRPAAAPPVPEETPFQAPSEEGTGPGVIPAPLPSAGPALGDFDSGEDRTMAYPAGMAPSLGGAGPQPFEEPPAPSEPASEFNPDSTRVATVSQELLRATSRSAPAEAPMAAPISAAPEIDAEEQHFQEIYREFVSTRERCGEPADGLTYEKFAAKLKKNKEQLVQKYACRTVRFQVHVKDGKAALKATPVKD